MFVFECWSNIGYNEFGTLAEAKAWFASLRLTGKIWQHSPLTGASVCLVEYTL